MITRTGKWKAIRIAITSVALFGGWLLFTGTIASTSLAIGAVLSFLVALLTYDLFIDITEVERRSLIPRIDLLILFLLVVIYRMYVASFKVLFSVLRGKINPRVVHFRTRLKSDLARVVLTSAITMTPGTITLNLDDDHLIVHWLDAKTTHGKLAGEIIKGPFERLLRKVWI